MPLFDYECRDCKKTSEILVSAGREPVCPHCGSKKLDKQVSAFSSKGLNKNSDAGGHVHSGGCCGGRCGCKH